MAPSLYSLARQVWILRDYNFNAVRRIQHQYHRYRMWRGIRAIRRYRAAALDTDHLSSLFGLTWRRTTRVLHDEQVREGTASDPVNVRYLMDASRIRMQMQRFVRGLQRVVARARRWFQYELMWRAMHHDMLPGETWRGLTRRIVRMLHVRDGGVHAYPSDFVRAMMTATRQRFAMQRFARGLRRVVARARRSFDYGLVWRAMHFERRPGETWRGLTRRIVGTLHERDGGVRNYANVTIRALMTATRQRFAMQRLVRGLRARVANSQRRVRRRLR